jgi:hypothetical protein
VTTHEARLGAFAAALVAPPSITHLVSSLIVSSRLSQSGLDLFSILIVMASGFGAAILMLKPRPWNATLAALLYFPSMFVLIFWIGYRAGYYDLPWQRLPTAGRTK